MKKILLTITRGSIARNLLQNDFYLDLREKNKILLLTPAAGDPRFEKEFGHPNVSFGPLVEIEHTLADRILFFFHKYLIYNQTVEQKAKWGIMGTPYEKRPSAVSYWLKKIIFTPLSHLHFLRTFARWLDCVFLQKKEVAFFRALLQKEKPDAVVVTNISADTEAALIKAARKEKIRTVGMPKSWDSLSKVGLRAKPDTLVVWSDFMQEQAMEFNGYTKEEIQVVGIPQFDYYSDRTRLWTREKFCSLYGLDPNKKIILFGSEGKTFPTDADVADLLYEGVSKNVFSFPCELLVRPHYGYKKDEMKFSRLFGKPGAVVDLFNNPSNIFRDEWDYSNEFMDRFLNSLYHSDVMINTASTLALDAAFFDKPVIHIMFEGKETLPPERSVRRWYATHYYEAILRAEASITASNRAELSNAIERSLADPQYKAKEREALREKFCGPLDGQAGKRFADSI